MLEEADMEKQTLKGIWDQIKFNEKWTNKLRGMTAQTYQQYVDIRKAGFTSKGLSPVWMGTYFHERMEEELKRDKDKPLFTIYCSAETLPVYQELFGKFDQEIAKNSKGDLVVINKPKRNAKSKKRNKNK